MFLGVVTANTSAMIYKNLFQERTAITILIICVGKIKCRYPRSIRRGGRGSEAFAFASLTNPFGGLLKTVLFPPNIIMNCEWPAS